MYIKRASSYHAVNTHGQDNENQKINAAWWNNRCLPPPHPRQPHKTHTHTHTREPNTLRTKRYGIRIPAVVKRFFSSPKRPDRLWGQPNLLFKQIQVSPPRPGYKAAEMQSLPLTPKAKVKNEWSNTSTPPLWLHGVDKFTFSSLVFTHNLTLWAEDRIFLKC